MGIIYSTHGIYAKEHKILFNAKKSQLLHFTKFSKSRDPQLFMNDGSIIPSVDTCSHLGNTISLKSDKIILDNAVNDLYMRTNCRLSDFFYFLSVAHYFIYLTCTV